MFFPFCNPNDKTAHPLSHKDFQRFKLEMLKAMRDSLETRLAATTAAIETIERQLAPDDPETE
ncbi:MAG: hypothetical protein AAGG02_18210 [Cyanobacteria bacterium P01_H01_bin.15]